MRHRTNSTALLLAFAALAILTLAMGTPFLSVRELAEERTFTLVGGITELLRRGELFIGTVLLLFSVVFPYAKLAATVAAISRASLLPLWLRQGLHRYALAAGKFSMLDVFVVAIVIVVLKLEGMTDAASRPGVALFCLAILLSMISGVMVSFAHLAQEREMSDFLPPNKPSRAWFWGGVVALLLAVGVLGYAWHAARTLQIVSVRVSSKPGIALPSLRELLGAQPDLYVETVTALASSRTRKYSDAVLGNGLEFPLSSAVSLAQLREVRLWDARDSVFDTRHWKVRDPKLLDHVSHLELLTDGERFRFELLASPESLLRKRLSLYGGIALALAGGLMCFPTLVHAMRKHVV